MLATDKASVVQKLELATRQLDNILTTLIIKGDAKHFSTTVADLKLNLTNSDLETLKLIYAAGFKQGIKLGARTTLEQWSKSLVKILSES